MSDKSAQASQAKNYKLIVEKDVQIPLRDGVGSAPYTHYQRDYNSGAINTPFIPGETCRLTYCFPSFHPRSDR